MKVVPLLLASVVLLSEKALSFSPTIGANIRHSLQARRGITCPTCRKSPYRPTSTRSTWAALSSAEEASAPSTTDECNEVEALGLHIPFGLRQHLITNAHEKIAKRFWIVDNSGSMILEDGHCHLTNNGDHDQSCTRWDEVCETVSCHAQLASALSAPTQFRLLNPPKNGGPLIRGPQSFSVGYGLNPPKQAIKDCKRAKNVMLRNEPSGRTPLAASVKEVRRDIVKMLPQLEAKNSKVCLAIATDGCNYNKQNAGLEVQEEERNEALVRALESLRGLPVCVVVRLCTDHEPVVNFYNELDERLEGIDIDVLDDHMAEADEVYEHNPWLNYALVLHRLREMGQESRLFDLLDERPLTKEEVREFCILLFGCSDALLHSDWVSFAKEVDRLQQQERKHWNPRTESVTPWIDTQRLASM